MIHETNSQQAHDTNFQKTDTENQQETTTFNITDSQPFTESVDKSSKNTIASDTGNKTTSNKLASKVDKIHTSAEQKQSADFTNQRKSLDKDKLSQNEDFREAKIESIGVRDVQSNTALSNNKDIAGKKGSQIKHPIINLQTSLGELSVTGDNQKQDASRGMLEKVDAYEEALIIEKPSAGRESYMDHTKTDKQEVSDISEEINQTRQGNNHRRQQEPELLAHQTDQNLQNISKDEYGSNSKTEHKQVHKKLPEKKVVAKQTKRKLEEKNQQMKNTTKYSTPEDKDKVMTENTKPKNDKTVDDISETAMESPHKNKDEGNVLSVENQSKKEIEFNDQEIEDQSQNILHDISKNSENSVTKIKEKDTKVLHSGETEAKRQLLNDTNIKGTEPNDRQSSNTVQDSVIILTPDSNIIEKDSDDSHFGPTEPEQQFKHDTERKKEPNKEGTEDQSKITLQNKAKTNVTKDKDANDSRNCVTASEQQFKHETGTSGEPKRKYQPRNVLQDNAILNFTNDKNGNDSNHGPKEGERLFQPETKINEDHKQEVTDQPKNILLDRAKLNVTKKKDGNNSNNRAPIAGKQSKNEIKIYEEPKLHEIRDIEGQTTSDLASTDMKALTGEEKILQGVDQELTKITAFSQKIQNTGDNAINDHNITKIKSEIVKGKNGVEKVKKYDLAQDSNVFAETLSTDKQESKNISSTTATQHDNLSNIHTKQQVVKQFKHLHSRVICAKILACMHLYDLLYCASHF